MTDKEQAIQKYMKNLDLTREEAEQLWADDEADTKEYDLTKEQKKAVKKIAYTTSEKMKNRENVGKNRPKDATKVDLIQKIADFLAQSTDFNVNITNIQGEIAISAPTNEDSFTLKLTKHRKGKGKK